jgi:glycine betaine/proline transport system permease protein
MDVGDAFETLIQWLTTHFSPFFDTVSAGVGGVVDGLEAALVLPPAWAMIAGLTAASWAAASWRTGAFAAGGLSLIAYSMELWTATMETLALVLASTLLALVLGLPLGVAAAKSDWADRLLRPVLDFMQTMPAFVYLIPAVLLFRLGAVPGVIATVVFAMPPAVRLTNLGIRQVPDDVVEAARAFGSTPWQQLWKVDLPLALPTILAGVNQTIMLALSMTVIAALIGAGGLGEEVLKGITQLQIGLGFESGLAVVILAIVLDRITQGIGTTADPTSGGMKTA